MSVTKPYLYLSPRAATWSLVSLLISGTADMFSSGGDARTGASLQTDQGGDHGISVGFGRIPAEAEPDGCAGQFIVHAHRLQDMRRGDLAGRAGRAGTD